LSRFRAPPATWTPRSHAWAFACICTCTSLSSDVSDVSHRVMSSMNPLPLRAVEIAGRGDGKTAFGNCLSRT
jgi:hypothetical protein